MALSMELLALGEQVGARLQARQETVAVAESAAGGLIAAALLAVPGASAYFQGGAVVYTRDAKVALLHLAVGAVTDPRPSTEAHAQVLARGVRAALGATWGLGETGAAGPTGNRYGDAAGHGCFAVAGPVEEADTLETGIADRRANMEAFASGALRLLLNALGQAA
ncbi:MAG TPA: CinA family protein [Chloroflexota bacterium]|nr:CinA family protein [Chloroflexota bacterium]